MYSQPLTEAIAEAEKLVAAAPFIESEADLLEGLQYLAGCIAGMHARGVRLRPRPSVPAQSGTGPFTKMGLDNPDTLYFGTRVQPGHEYVVTGKRGTTTDLSFQLLGGEYTDDNRARSARRRSTTANSTSPPTAASNGGSRPNSPSQLVVREVYNDWSAQRGYIRHRSASTPRAPRRRR